MIYYSNKRGQKACHVYLLNKWCQKSYEFTKILMSCPTSYICPKYISQMTFVIYIHYIIKLTISLLHFNKIVLNSFNIYCVKPMSSYFVYIISTIFFSKCKFIISIRFNNNCQKNVCLH